MLGENARKEDSTEKLLSTLLRLRNHWRYGGAQWTFSASCSIRRGSLPSAPVAALVPVTRRALAMRSPKELELEIAERKKAEEALRESEEKFRGTFENAAVGIAHKDAEGRLLRVNERYCNIVGYTREELL